MAGLARRLRRTTSPARTMTIANGTEAHTHSIVCVTQLGPLRQNEYELVIGPLPCPEPPLSQTSYHPLRCGAICESDMGKAIAAAMPMDFSIQLSRWLRQIRPQPAMSRTGDARLSTP